MECEPDRFVNHGDFDLVGGGETAVQLLYINDFVILLFVLIDRYQNAIIIPILNIFLK